MKLEVFCLCDAATVSGGKLNILGIFDVIYAGQVPVLHAQCAIAIRLRFQRIEEGEHRLKLNVVDEDGHPVMRTLDGNLAVKFGPEDETSTANFIVNLQQLKLEKFGTYSIDMALDSRHEASLPLMVKPIQQPQPESEGFGGSPVQG